MVRYIHPDVENLASDPDAVGDERFALVVSDSHTADIEAEIERLGGSITRTLPSGVLIIEFPVSNLEACFEIDGIESISPTDSMINLA